jgi:hypothetical protein
MCRLSILLLAITVFLSSLLTSNIAPKFNTHLKGSINWRVLHSNPNLLLVLTSTYYKPSLYCLELISQDRLFTPLGWFGDQESWGNPWGRNPLAIQFWITSGFLHMDPLGIPDHQISSLGALTPPLCNRRPLCLCPRALVVLGAQTGAEVCAARSNVFLCRK